MYLNQLTSVLNLLTLSIYWPTPATSINEVLVRVMTLYVSKQLTTKLNFLNWKILVPGNEDIQVLQVTCFPIRIIDSVNYTENQLTGIIDR